MLKTLLNILLLFFIIHTSIAQVSSVRKEPILLTLNAEKTTFKKDNINSYSYITQSIKKDNNIVSEVTLSSIINDNTASFTFEITKILTSLNPDTKYLEMNNAEELIEYITQKYEKSQKIREKTKQPPLQSIANFTFTNLIIKDNRDKENIKYYQTKNHSNTFSILCKRY
ncbi:hypothetical protein [Myroides marinus]|uniref:hypothetical protein n=1 Tax=Myroides marinus TaxID=703342 RepID=UPI000AC5B08C|nr:hypothetical protein [Myroides marinus]